VRRIPDVVAAVVLAAGVLAAGVVPAACGERSAPAPAVSASAVAAAPTASASASAGVPLDPKAAAARYVKTMQGVAEVFTQNKNACGGLSERLRAYRNQHAEVLDAPAPELFGFIEADASLREQMKIAMATVMDGSMACRDVLVFQKMHVELGARAGRSGR